MQRPRGRPALDQRHQKVSSIVWGLTFIGLAGLLWTRPSDAVDTHLSRHAAERAVDGDPETRWSSKFDDDEWIRVDLGTSVEIDRVRLVWERAYARVYEIRLSDDGEEWRTVVRADDVEGGTEEHRIGARGRHVQVRGLKRATGYGFSLWEFEVYGPPGPEAAEDATGPLLSRGRPATASSVETVPVPSVLVAFWFDWWPLLVVAAGLPHLVVPRSHSEELGGLVTVAVGVLFLLDKSDWSWTWRQAAPVVLVLVGALVLTQGLRPAGGPDEAAAQNPNRPR